MFDFFCLLALALARQGCVCRYFFRRGISVGLQRRKSGGMAGLNNSKKHIFQPMKYRGNFIASSLQLHCKFIQ